MKFIYIFLLALIAFQAAFASDASSITKKLKSVDNECDKLASLNTNVAVTASVAASIEAEIVAIVNVIVAAQSEISAFSGIFAVADANAFIQLLIDIAADIQVGIQAIISLQVSLAAIGADFKVGQNLADLQVAVNAFVGVFLGKIPSASKTDATNVCNNLKKYAQGGCSAYSSCSQ